MSTPATPTADDVADRERLLDDLLARAARRFVVRIVGTLAASVLVLAYFVADLGDKADDLKKLKAEREESRRTLERLRADVEMLKAERLYRRIDVAKNLHSMPWR